MPIFRLPAALLALAASAAVAGCGSSNVKDSGIPDGSQTGTIAADTSSTPTKPAVDAAKQYAGTAPGPIGNAQDLGKEPKIPKPSGAAPKQLVAKDLVVGSGPAAASGDALTVRYVGASFSDGKVFDKSWGKPGNAFPFTLGQGAVITGWDKGIVGMKAGGRRELVIPASDGYGAQGSPPSIKPNATLVFVVDLKKIG